MKTFALIALGSAILFGNIQSREFFLMTLNYFVYIVCTISLYLLNFTASFFENKLYEDVVEIFTNLPTNIVWHFIDYPEAFMFCGLMMILVGMTSAKA